MSGSLFRRAPVDLVLDRAANVWRARDGSGRRFVVEFSLGADGVAFREIEPEPSTKTTNKGEPPPC